MYRGALHVVDAGCALVVYGGIIWWLLLAISNEGSQVMPLLWAGLAWIIHLAVKRELSQVL